MNVFLLTSNISGPGICQKVVSESTRQLAKQYKLADCSVETLCRAEFDIFKKGNSPSFHYLETPPNCTKSQCLALITQAVI